LCHRYFYSWKTDTSTKTDYFEGSSSYSWPSMNMPTPMRAKPSATIYSYTTRYTAADDNTEVTRTVQSASVKGGWFNTTRSGDFIMTSCAVKCSDTGLFTKQGGYSGMMGDFDAEL